MLRENIKEALVSIWGNKMRSLLTMLGIIIGIGAVILITMIGSSIQSTLTATLNSIGNNYVSVYVSARYPEDDADWETWEYPDMEEDDYVSQDMVDELMARYPDEVAGVAAEEWMGEGQIVDDTDADRYANVYVDGVTPGYLGYITLSMSVGRDVTRADGDGAKRVCVISDVAAENFFENEDPIGRQVTVTMGDEDYFFTVVGVYEYEQALFGRMDSSSPKDMYTYMYIPYQTALSLEGAAHAGYKDFTLMLSNLADVDLACAHIQDFFDEKYASNANFQVYSYYMFTDLESINQVIRVITIAVSAIAAISLVVGGVGVMNIMLVSITERTREIGIRMALGARRRSIRFQFVIEAIVLCLIGGIIGILIGLALGAVTGIVAQFLIQNMYSDMAGYIVLSVHPSATAILLSLFFSMLIGVFFGSYPANKAARMEVIDALRYE